jgi:protein FAM50
VESLRQEVRKRERAEKRKKMASSLSFLGDEEAEDEESESVVLNKPKKKLSKNPDVDTTHLPDRERDEKMKEERDRLTQEWLREQERIKTEV